MLFVILTITVTITGTVISRYSIIPLFNQINSSIYQIPFTTILTYLPLSYIIQFLRSQLQSILRNYDLFYNQYKNYWSARIMPTAHSTNDSTNSSSTYFQSAQDITRTVYTSENLEKAEQKIAQVMEICELEAVPVEFSWNTQQELPENYEIAIVPMTETIKDKGRVTMSILVCAIPSVQAVLSDAGGAVWAVKKLTDLMVNQVKTARNKMIDMAEMETFPFTVTDFVSTGTSSVYAGFNGIAADYVKALKKKSATLSFLSKGLLRQILASAQFAEQQFPRIAQDKWVFIINSMIQSCKAEGVDPGILAHWFKTRHEIEVENTDVDFGDLDSMIAKEQARITAVAKAKEAKKIEQEAAEAARIELRDAEAGRDQQAEAN